MLACKKVRNGLLRYLLSRISGKSNMTLYWLLMKQFKRSMHEWNSYRVIHYEIKIYYLITMFTTQGLYPQYSGWIIVNQLQQEIHDMAVF